jgi:hypothetical protein
MDPKKARETLRRLCAEWDRAGQLMNRYVRPAGFSLALGVGLATGAGCSSTVSSDSARDALPPSADAYGTLDRPVLDRPPIPRDGGVDIVDSAKDALPNAVDIYGVSADGRVDIVDSAREALPYAQDAYGVAADRFPIPLDGRVDIVDSARDALPPAQDVYGVLDRPPLPRDGGVDGPAVDALLDAADAADAIAALDGADSGAGD